MKINNQTTIGAIVAYDFRTAALFSKYKIDFCCKGDRTLEAVCTKKNISQKELIDALEALLNNSQSYISDYGQWSLDLLIDYIETTHHHYVEEKTPVLLQFLDKLCKVHGEKHPELLKINALFSESAGELAMHMKKEELVLFPFIRQMVNAKKEGSELKRPHFGSVSNPVTMMRHEHDTEGERFDKIATLTNQYTPPADACNTYKVTYAMLQEFENDLHKHIHLENNILFPKAITLEADFNN
ncbi:iron-sulfur cluster repair di-iron protein [Flavobacterium supellecticarium]|uniref:Iron-sulfur cluster repair di-iron protein n=1 Tax=Flavobacterium supellecticarium TaxID=2565924 RepID=A0A4S3ZPJ4_9FLAO|nr:iron-sulfur cluster repair di-iron protein [Flavobacterium supellecticarium]THF47427.1 iron-sulfur cluster repair di-iron protein [Flavobacterium supellecticarium]